MGVQEEIKFFHARFKSVSRPRREKILCAMIRINYGTPWGGDHEILVEFFPDWYHKKLGFGGLTELIEALSPFADEPTDAGLVAEEPTLPDADVTVSLVVEENKISELTADLP